MIARNVGTFERLVRLMLAAGLATWIVSSGVFGIAQAVATIAALALLWNSIFGRCYLWKWLRLSTCPRADGVCHSATLAGTGADQNAASGAVDTLYYDGQCSLCAAEITRLREQRAGALALVDIHAINALGDNAPGADTRNKSRAGAESDPAADKDRLLRTLHLRRADGSWLTGADANVAAWEGTRHGRSLAFLRWPLIRYPVDLGYALWARWRYTRLYGRGRALRPSSRGESETTTHVPD